jgi:putative endonuclease
LHLNFSDLARHNETGRLGEDLAVNYLEGKGFIIFDRNYNFEKAEVDIVAFIPDELHFIEVKTRTETEGANPEDAVTAEKKKRMAKVAGFYQYERQMMTVPVVFDVIAVTLRENKEPEILHLEDAFRPESSF